jgi:hypothetical protein
MLAENVTGMGVRKMHRLVRREKVNKRGHMGDLSLHKKIILKRILKKNTEGMDWIISLL